MYLRIAYDKNPTIFMLHKFKNMKQYNAISLPEKPLHSSHCLTLILTNLVQYLTTSLPLPNQPCSYIPGIINPLLIRKLPSIYCAIHLRRPKDLMHELYNFIIIWVIVIFPLTPISTGPSLELTCNNYLLRIISYLIDHCMWIKSDLIHWTYH